MENNNELDECKYRYDAFISYRHCNLDSFVAERLHKALEAYKLPGNVKRKLIKQNADAKTRIARVFRDEEELPLSSDLEGSIVSALKNSEWLIVVCSPRLPESAWCRKEIETFIEFHGIDHVLALLIEGEPIDSFPDELLHRDVKVVGVDGIERLERKNIEPMAADVRGTDKRSVKKNLSNELLRLCAPMFGLTYDELKQRHREHKIKRLFALVSAIAAAFWVLFMVSFSVSLKIKAQSVQIEQKNEELKQQKEQIENQNNQILIYQAQSLAGEAFDALNQDDRSKALECAYSALTQYQGIPMPYTEEAVYALTQSVNPYEVLGDYNPAYTIPTKGNIKHTVMSPNEDVLAIVDDTGVVTFWSTKDYKQLGTVVIDESGDAVNSSFMFINNDKFLYDDGYVINVYSISSDSQKEVYTRDFAELFNAVSYDSMNHRIMLSLTDCIICFDDRDYKEVCRIPVAKGAMVKKISCLNGKYIAIFYNTEIDLLNSAYDTVHSLEYNDNPNATVDFDTIYIREYNNKLFLMYKGYDFSAGDQWGKSFVKAYDLDTHKQIWSRNGDYTEFNFGEMIGENADRICLFEFGDETIVELDAATGEELMSEKAVDEIVWCGFFQNKMSFVDASANFYSVGNYACFPMFDITVNCNLKNVRYVEINADNVFLAEEDCDEVICYRENLIDGMKEYQGNTYEPGESDYIRNKEEIAEVGLPDGDMIIYILYDDKHEKMCATERDGTVLIYDVSTLEQIGEFKINKGDTVDCYFGTDNFGNSYWGNANYGYQLSPNYKITAKLNLIRGVDNDKNELVFGFEMFEKRGSFPIYSTDEILVMAKEIMDTYGN